MPGCWVLTRYTWSSLVEADVDSWAGAALCNMKMSESVRILIEPDNEDVTGAGRRVLRA